MTKQRVKIGRNDLCPCNSGKKFKKCHGGSVSPPAMKPGQIDASLKKLSPPKICLVPDSIRHECTGAPIDSHTVSRSGSLGEIELYNHVYSYKLSIQGLEKSGGKVLPSLTGWRNASTFPGFCTAHDKKLFAPLEDSPFTGSKQQCFLLAYRAVNYEFYAKFGSSLHNQYRKTITTGNQTANHFVELINQGVNLGLRDAQRHKKYYDDLLITEDWEAVRTELIEFDGIFPIQCAAAFFPDRDVNGVGIQNLGVETQKLDVISISSFAANGKSYFCLCWLADSDASCKAFVYALNLVPRESLPIVLGSLILQTSENCHFSPAWYDSLSADGKEWCRDQMMNGMLTFSDSPISSVKLTYLSNQSIKSITFNA